MRRLSLSCLWLAVGMASAAAADTQAPVPEKLPFDTPYGQSISLADAKKAVAAAEAEAERRQWRHVIVVVDASGNLVNLVKMDNTQLASIEVAQAKAWTAVRFRRPTKTFQDTISGGNAAPLSLPSMIAVEGGFPLVIDGKLVGAIAASGGTGAQDSVVAQAGVAALAEAVKKAP